MFAALAVLVCLMALTPAAVSAHKEPTPSSFGYSRAVYSGDEWTGLLNCGSTVTKFWYSLEQILFNARNATTAEQKLSLAVLADEYLYSDDTRYLVTAQQPTYLLTLNVTKPYFADLITKLLPFDKGEHHVGSAAIFDLSETQGKKKDTLYVVSWNDQSRVRGATPLAGGDALIDSRKQMTCIMGKQKDTNANVMFIYDINVSARSRTASGQTVYNEAGVVIPRPHS